MLSDTTIRQLKPKPKAYKVSDEKGLHIDVRPTGAKYWRVKYRFAGKEKSLSLGVYPEVSLKKARQKCLEAREHLADGEDPGKLKRLAKLNLNSSAENCFGIIAEEWYEQQLPHWSESHSSRVKRSIDKDLSPIRNRPITDITPPELLATLRKIETRGAIETAHRVKQVAGQIFRYAVATSRAERDTSRDLDGALAKPIKSHFPAITDPVRVGELLRAIDGYTLGTSVVRAALKLAPLLFVRPGELRHMEWSEIDLEGRMWKIPKTKMKSGKDHWVPLSTQAVLLLKEIQPHSGYIRYVFPGQRSLKRPMSDNAIRSALMGMGIPKEEMSGHGFRAMARTLLAEELEFDAHLIEHQLAHAVKGPLGATYDRTSFIKQRVVMMQAWANYLEQLKSLIE